MSAREPGLVLPPVVVPPVVVPRVVVTDGVLALELLPEEGGPLLRRVVDDLGALVATGSEGA